MFIKRKFLKKRHVLKKHIKYNHIVPESFQTFDKTKGFISSTLIGRHFLKSLNFREGCISIIEAYIVEHLLFAFQQVLKKRKTD